MNREGRFFTAEDSSQVSANRLVPEVRCKTASAWDLAAKPLQARDDCTNGVHRVLPEVVGNAKVICDRRAVEGTRKPVVNAAHGEGERRRAFSFRVLAREMTAGQDSWDNASRRSSQPCTMVAKPAGL